MTSDHLYDLLEQLVIENKSLWRIRKNYSADAGDCDHCIAYWKKLGDAKENTVKELEAMVKDHMA